MKRKLPAEQVSRALAAREISNQERRAAIRQILYAAGLLVDGKHGPPPMIKLRAAREAVKQAGSALTRAVEAEQKFNAAVNIDHT